VGIVLLLAGRELQAAAVVLVAIALMWLAGVWVVPRGVDAYHRQVRRLLEDWEAAAGESEAAIVATGDETLAGLERVRPPASCRAAHGELLAALDAYLAALHGSGEDALARYAELTAALDEDERRRWESWSGGLPQRA